MSARNMGHKYLHHEKLSQEMTTDSELAFDKDKIGFMGLNSEISIRFKYKKSFLTIKTKLTLTTLKQKG